MATKAELIAAVADRCEIDKKDTEAVLVAFFDHTAEQIKAGEKVTWPKFGSFTMAERAPRMGRNPQNGDPVKIGMSRSVRFSTSAPLKDWLKGRNKKR